MSAEYNIESGVITLLSADAYFQSASIGKRHWSDNSQARGVAIIVNCEAKEPDMLTATGRATSWKSRLSLTPVTFTPDDKSGAAIELMADHAHRFIEALTKTSLQTHLTKETIIGIEADSSERKLDDRWNERTVSILIYYTETAISI